MAPDVPEPEPEPEPEFVPVLGNPLQDTRNTRQTVASVDPKAFTALPPGEDLIPKIFLIWFGTDGLFRPGSGPFRTEFLAFLLGRLLLVVSKVSTLSSISEVSTGCACDTPVRTYRCADTFELYFRIALLATGRITEKAALLQNYKNRPVQVIENLCLLGPDEFLVPLWELARTHFSAR